MAVSQSTPSQTNLNKSASALAHQIADLALTKKADDVTILDLRGLTSIADYFVIASGASDTQVKAIVDAITDGLEPESSPWHREGYESLRWVLLDFVDVVVHVFQRNIRDFYGLENLWSDAEIEQITEEDLTE